MQVGRQETGSSLGTQRTIEEHNPPITQSLDPARHERSELGEQNNIKLGALGVFSLRSRAGLAVSFQRLDSCISRCHVLLAQGVEEIKP